MKRPSALAAWTLALGFSAFPCGAEASTKPARLARIAELRDAAGRGAPRAYVALRELWQEWDQGDPREVEEALRDVAADKSIAPPVRSYGALLAAYARRRRGDLDGAESQIRKLGFVSAWQVVGPFDNEGKTGLARAFEPEVSAESPSAAKSYDGKERPVRWRLLPSGAPFGWIDLGNVIRPAEKGCSYASTYVRDRTLADGKSRAISLWAGSAGAFKLFWNGQEVMVDPKYRSLDADRQAAAVVLEGGWNRLLVKVCGEEDAPLFSVRLADDKGAPDERLESSGDAAHHAAAATKKGRRAPSLLAGPIDAFERAAKGESAEALEAYARYLVLSLADDPAERKARELARKAAERGPSVSRLLLAGELAESRNPRAQWIERAEAMVAKGGATGGVSERDRIAVLHARAAHARSGVYFRDAMPFYDRILAQDPDDVTALLARFELYLEADLASTATTLLERAVTRRPRSVALLRALASSLRQQGRVAEATEIEERYAQLRFDDPGYLRDRIELAVARRDKASAARLRERLMRVMPDHLPTLLWVARSALQLGEPERALPLLRRCLELAPEDIDALRALADANSVLGKRDEQLALLRKVLVLKPQAKEVREYLSQLEPERPRPDEAYARPSSEFLKLRGAPADGASQRTLSSLRVTTVYPNGLASRFNQLVWQPLTESAAQEARQYAFTYEADSETVQLRGARVFRKSGAVEEAVDVGEGPANNPAMVMYTSGRTVYVRFARVEVGDVVELRYRQEDVSARNAFADYFGEVTTFPSNEPVARAEYVLITPKSRTFHFNEPRVAGLKRTSTEGGSERIDRFVAENLAPLPPEPLQPPYSELLGYVHVSTYKSWEDVGRWYWGLVKDQFVADDEVRRRTQEITKGLTDPRAKVKAVYNWVVQKTRYVALEFGIHGFKPYRCAQIFARGFGDCKDKATLIVTMLKELGIPATIVIVRTGMRGDFDEKPASLAPFDHAIAYVPSMDLYLDGTAEWTGSSELPAMDRGALALQINEGNAKLVRLPDAPAAESVSSKTIEVNLEADGKATIDLRAEVTGVSAPGFRERYHATSTRKARLQEDLSQEVPGLEIAAVEANDLLNLEEKVSLRVRGKSSIVGKREGDRLSLAVGPRESMVRDYAALSRRSTDLRLRARSTTEQAWKVKLPPGMKVADLPAAQSGTTPFGSYRLRVEQTGNVVSVSTTVTLDKSRIKASEYGAFRAFCESADRALGQRLVLAR